MSAVSASPAERRVLVWDAPTRIFHWLMVLAFALAYATGDSERWRLLHLTLGYTMAGLVAFRLAWGLVGTRYARFASFVRGPRAVARYVRSVARLRPEPHVGHNPAGAVAIVLLLALTAVVALTGWLALNEIGGHALEEIHEGAAAFMLAVVAIHVLGVVVGSFLHGENLVRAMLTGRKAAPAGEGIASPWRSVAAVVLAAVLAFWWTQWQSAPSLAAMATASSPHADGDDGEDDRREHRRQRR